MDSTRIEKISNKITLEKYGEIIKEIMELDFSKTTEDKKNILFYLITLGSFVRQNNKEDYISVFNLDNELELIKELFFPMIELETNKIFSIEVISTEDSESGLERKNEFAVTNLKNKTKMILKFKVNFDATAYTHENMLKIISF